MAGNKYDTLLNPTPSGPSRAQELLSRYDSILDDNDRKRASLNVLPETNADTAARANRYERDMGVPAALAQDDITLYDRAARQRQVERAAQQHPNIGRFMADPRAAAVAHDDVPTLQDISRNFQAFWNRPKPPADNRTWLQRTRDAVVNAPSNIAGAVGAGTVRLAQGLTEVARSWNDLQAALDPTTGLQRNLTGGTIYDWADRQLGTYSKMQGRVADSVAPDYKSMGFVERSLLQGVESVPGSVAALGAGLAGQPGAGLALLGAQTGGQSYREAKDAGRSTGSALNYALGQGGIEVLTEKIPVLRFLEDTKIGTPFFKRLAKNFVAEQVGEQTATALQDFNQWAVIGSNQGKTFGDYLRERPEAAAATALAVAATVGTTNVAIATGEKITAKADKVLSARANAATIKALSDTAAASKLRARDPVKFREFVDQTVQGTDAEHVYIPVEAIDKYMQSDAFKDDDGVFEALQPQIDEARATKGDVVIPTADVMAKLAGTPAWEALQQDARIDAGGLSVAESLRDGETITADIAKRGEEIAKAAQDDATAAEPVQQVFEEVRDKLTAIGQPLRVATQNAALFAANREAWGARLGQSATEYHAANPVQFERGVFGADAGDAQVLTMDQSVPVDDLSAHEKADLVQSLAVEFVPGFDMDVWQRVFGEVDSYTDDQIGQQIFNLTDPLMVQRVKVNPSEVDNKARATSPTAVATYKKQRETSEPPAIIVRREGEQWKIVEGGHRLKAAQEAGATSINAIDITGLVGMNWEQYLAGETTGEMPLRSNPQTLNQSPVFYSALGRAIEESKTAKAPASQWKATLQNAPGVKAEELEWSGLLDLLDFDPKKTFTRDELADAVRASVQQKITALLNGLKPQSVGEVANDFFGAREGSIPTLSIVDAGVIAATQYDQVRQAVIADLSVNVVNNLADEKFTPQDFFRDPNMVADALTVDQRSRMSNGFLDALRNVGTTLRTELTAARDAGSDRELLGTLKASELDPLVIVSLLSPQLLYHDGASSSAIEGGKTSASAEDASTGFGGELQGHLGIAPLADFLNWHDQLVSKTGNSLQALSPLFQNTSGPRGQIALYGDRSVVTLFENSDLSTLIHETGHLFLSELQVNAERDNAPQDVKDDWAAVQKWFADNKVPLANGAIPREAHELFARGFERYAMEGKAPSAYLQSAFASFRAWLLRIYQVVQNLRSPITPEIRGVFDRLLATQAAIDEYSRQQEVRAAFTDAQQAGMTEAEWQAYQRSIVQAKDDAYDALLFKTMHRIRVARSAEHKAETRVIRDEATQATNDEPRFRALRLLRTGKIGDDTVNVRLDRAWLKERYGDDAEARLPANVRVADENTADADGVAEMTGFASGADMVEAMFEIATETAAMRASGDKRQLSARLIDERVEAAVTARGLVDPLTDGTIEEEAIAAINNDRQGDVLATELRHLARRTAERPTPYRLARDWAARKIAAGTVRDVASRSALQRYARAAAKAAKAAEAAIIEGNTDEAFRQKQAQMLNHALYAEAKVAADEIDTITARMKRLGKRAAMKSIDQDYFDRVHELLEAYDFRPQSQKLLDEKEDFATWAANRQAQGFEVHTPPRLLENGAPYTRVNVEDLYALRDAVDSLMALGRHKQNLLDAKAERDFNGFIQEVVERIDQLPDRTLPDSVNEDPSFVRGAMSELLKIETIAADLDNDDPHGPLTRLLVQRASDAETERNRLRDRTLAPIAKQYLDMPPKERARLEERITLPELPYIGAELDPRNGQPSVMTRMELLSVALNTGNTSNFEKLARGEKWSPDAIRAVLDRELTAFDWQFVQSIWDSIDTLWPDIALTERKLSGVVPEKVERTPITTRHGVFAGGYYPVVYDYDRSQQAENYKADDLNDLFGFASGVGTPKGHTITRTAAVGPIRRSVEDVIFRHVERVVTRIAYAEYARDVLRVIEHPRVRSAIDLKLGKEYRQQIKPWLKRVVNAGAVDGRGARWMEQFMRSARTNMAIVAMGFRMSTGIAQTFGLTASAGKIGSANVARGLRQLILSPKASADFVFSRSSEMERRNVEVNREIGEFHKQVRGKTGLLTQAQQMAFWHIGMIDRYMVALPTWLGAHGKGIAEGMTDEQASRYADAMVRQSQGSGAEKDLASIQSTANGEAMKWLTLFYTYFNVQFNAQWEAGRATKRGNWRKAMVLTGWFMVAAPLLDALAGGDVPWGDDDDKPLPQSWAEWFGRNVFFNLFSGLPGVRDAAGILERKMAGQFAGNITTPFGRILDSTERAAGAAHDIYAKDDAVTGRQIQTISEAPGYFLGLPTGQIGATSGFLWDYAQGQTEPDSFTDWFYGLTKGKVPEKKDK